MSFSADALYNLLPAVYRIRDADHGGVLRQLVQVIAEQTAALEEDLDQLYDDQFIETCAPWVIPYLGDLIGYRASGMDAAGLGASRTAVADLIDLRRSKGTAAALAKLAADLTGESALVVEFFRRLAITQYLNHGRLDRRLVDMRDVDALLNLNTPFDTSCRTIDIRRISSGRGKHNIPNIGIFLWGIQAQSVREGVPVQLDARRFVINPLGADQSLFIKPVSEGTAPSEFPQPLGKRRAARSAETFYGREQTIWIERNNTLIPASQVKFCDLSDLGPVPETSPWANMPSAGVAIDPELGRIAFSDDVDTSATPVDVSYLYGFPSDIGGGAYDRAKNLRPAASIASVPASFATVQSAIASLGGSGIVEITGNGRYTEALILDVTSPQSIEIRAANQFRPTLVLTSDLTITGGDGSSVTLNGLLLAGGRIHVPAQVGGVANQLGRLRLLDCTLVPGLAVKRSGDPVSPGAPCLVVESANTEVVLERCIVGAIQVESDSSCQMTNCIVDANGEAAAAYAGIAGTSGGPLTLATTTVIGTVATLNVVEASNSIFLGQVQSDRVQDGCVRYSFIPGGSRVPRRYNCQPASGADELAVRPRFASLRYGSPAYCRLRVLCPSEIRQGASDGSEMGVYHDLFEAPRWMSLCRSLEEFSPFGMEAGIFSAT